MEFVIISGLSGAGKSKASEFLEDAGYYTVDNMPAPLMLPFAQLCLDNPGPQYEKVALVSDIRGGVDFTPFLDALKELRSLECTCRLLFLEASTPAVIKRYKETRRTHPLCADGEACSLESAIEREKQLLADVRAEADLILDSTNFATTGQLRNALLDLFGTTSKESMKVQLLSFGYKYGIPLEADLLMDVRFLPNPFYIPELRKKTGLDKEVQDFLNQYEETHQFLALYRKNMEFLLPLYAEEGKSVLVIGIGCTGGQHRSVAMCHAIAEIIRSLDYPVTEYHRDAAKERK